MLSKIQKHVSRLRFFYIRNNSKILMLKIVKSVLRIEFNYALSIVFPNNKNLLNKHLISKQITSPTWEISDTLLDNDSKVVFRNSFYNEEYLVEMQQILVDTQTGIAFVRADDPIAILESSNILAIEVSDSLRPRVPKKFLEGEWFVLSSRSFAHWLLQDVPRFLRLIELKPDIRIAISNQAEPYVHSFLKMCNIVAEAEMPVVHLEKYTFISAQYPIGIPSNRDIETLRQFQEKYFEVKTVTKKRDEKQIQLKIYVSRRFSKRPLPNELDIEVILSSHGYQIVYLERMPLDKQIEMFSSARIICGAHGAGLYNIVWAKNCDKVIEIYDETFKQDSLRQIAERIDIPHHGIHYLEALLEKDLWE